MQYNMDEIKRLQEERKSSSASDDNSDRILLGAKSHGFDTNIYGDGDDGNQYFESLPTEDEENGDDDDEHMHPSTRSRMSTAKEILDENLNSNDGNVMAGYREQFGSGLVNTRISDRESEVRGVAYFFLHIQIGEFTSLPIVFHL